MDPSFRPSQRPPVASFLTHTSYGRKHREYHGSLLTHARDRRENIAYRASLEPDDDVLELKHDEIVFEPEADKFFAIERLHHPSTLYEGFAIGVFIAGLGFLPLSLFVSALCLIAFLIFLAIANSSSGAG